MAVFYLRERIRKVQTAMNRDLRLMTGEYGIFMLHSVKELERILSTKKMIDAMIIFDS